MPQAFSAQLAKQTDFAGYVRGHLDHPQHRGARNFQTFRPAFNEPASTGSEIARAIRTIQQLPFFGLVEDYDQSVGRFETLVKPYFPTSRPSPFGAMPPGARTYRLKRNSRS
jgi:hypothetical protein